MVRITRIYADENGESHFTEKQVSVTKQGEIGFLSEPVPVEHLLFRETTPNYDYDFHHAPARQFILLLDGEIEIETSLGETRIFRGGDILLVEDTHGKGHKTRQLSPGIRTSIFVTLKSK